MSIIRFNGFAFTITAFVGLLSLFSHQAYAVTTLYSHDFEAAPIGQFCCPQGGLFTSTGNIGGNDLIWEHTATGGANGSKGLDVLFDGTGRPFYSIALTDFEPTASDANPLGNGMVSSPSQIRFSFDLSATGSIASMPIRLRVSQTDPNYEADRGIDANMDGDMTDSATNYASTFTPVIVDGGDHQRIVFSLDQGQQSAFIVRTSPGFAIIPLAPEFDPTVSLGWSIAFDYAGFGSDAGNVVSIDNVRIDAVPEPTTLTAAFLAVCLAALAVRCRTSIA